MANSNPSQIWDVLGGIKKTLNAAGGGKKGGGADTGGKLSPLKQFAQVVAGFAAPGSVSKEARQALAKLDVSGIKYRDLARFGLDDALSKGQFKEFKGLFKEAQKNNGKIDQIGKREIRELARFAKKATIDAKLDDIKDDANDLVPDEKELARQRGRLAKLDMSIFAARAVDRAQGVRAAVATTPTGARQYGARLARISLGAL